eukprot:scpid40615/ scgid31421/ TNF receptor-associated factor 3; CD40 receptor-associated factor 1; TRAFAMN
MSCSHSEPSSEMDELDNPYARQPVAARGRNSNSSSGTESQPQTSAAAAATQGPSSSAQPDHGGYDAHFDPPLDKKLECPICLYALRDPIQTTCGHRFCKSCIERSLRAESKTCPVDKRQLSKTDIYPDNWCRREVMCLTCKCRHVQEGCTWHGQLKDFEDHVQSSCEYMTVACRNDGCEEKVARKNLSSHMKHDCLYRKVVCQYCDEYVAILEIETHNSECVKFPVACPQECGEEVPRCELPEHVAQMCELSEVECRHSGCTWKGVRSEYSTHCDESMVVHVEISAERQDLQDGNVVEVRDNLMSVQTQLDDVRDIVQAMQSSANGDSKAMELTRSLADKLVNISRVVDHTVLRVSDVESRLIQLERRVTTDRAAFNVLSEKFERSTVSFHDQITTLLTLIEKQNGGGFVSLPQLPAMPQMPSLPSAPAPTNVTSHVTTAPNPADPAASYDGTMLWKVNGWRELRTKAVDGKRTSVYSSPFYTSIRGYKVRVRLYPNGDGMGRSNSLSVFFTLCRGEFDAILTWPFTSKVTFTLLDRGGTGMDLSESFVPDSNSSSFHKPKSDMNIASGCPLFVPLHRVNDGGSYVQSDSIWLRVVVEPKADG